MTQDKNMLIDGRSVRLTQGPSAMDMMLSLFGDKIIIFKAGNQEFYVKVTALELIDGDHTCWKIEGSFCLDPIARKYSRCRIRFWGPIRKGILTELAPKTERFTLKYLDTLSDDQLRKEITSWQSLAADAKESLLTYSSQLNEHDRLVIEARMSQILLEASFHTELDHKLLRAGSSLTVR
mgnify:CR=1 FL=1